MTISNSEQMEFEGVMLSKVERHHLLSIADDRGIATKDFSNLQRKGLVKNPIKKSSRLGDKGDRYSLVLVKGQLTDLGIKVVEAVKRYRASLLLGFAADAEEFEKLADAIVAAKPTVPVPFYPGDGTIVMLDVSSISGGFPRGADGITCAYCHGDPGGRSKDPSSDVIKKYLKENKWDRVCPCCEGRQS